MMSTQRILIMKTGPADCHHWSNDAPRRHWSSLNNFKILTWLRLELDVNNPHEKHPKLQGGIFLIQFWINIINDYPLKTIFYPFSQLTREEYTPVVWSSQQTTAKIQSCPPVFRLVILLVSYSVTWNIPQARTLTQWEVVWYFGEWDSVITIYCEVTNITNSYCHLTLHLLRYFGQSQNLITQTWTAGFRIPFILNRTVNLWSEYSLWKTVWIGPQSIEIK